MIKWAVYEREYGNVFDWIIKSSELRRQLKARERLDAIKKAAEKSKSLDQSKVEDKKWKAVNAR